MGTTPNRMAIHAMITIRCDRVDSSFKQCDAQLSGLSFNTKPAGWTIVDLGHGDHMDYCPQHQQEATAQ